MNSRVNQSGLTITEILIYVTLLAFITTTLIGFSSRLIYSLAVARTTSTTLENARASLSLITQDIRQANDVYTPTSVFDTHPGQISLATPLNIPSDETESFVDYYVDDSRLYRKREGQIAELITSEQVRITNLVFTHFEEANDSSAVQISITVTPAENINSVDSITLVTTSTLRVY